ncbi:MAG: zinc dependent phospholipase C family protein [Christensenellaceae bacterium]|jgi:hypothetical protein|nr:zinc dependent phospholipase C family protein [Christensenellaceae bacterium]
MPSNAFHYYFAKCVYDKMPDEIKHTIDTDKSSYLLGGQGPDILFYLKILRNIDDPLGSKVHSSFSTLEMFESSAIYIDSTTSDSIFPFLLGQLCHYALDANVHPYVYFRELDDPKFCDKGTEKFYHINFEAALDYICIEEYQHKNSRRYRSAKHVNISSNALDEIGKYYESVVAPMADETLKASEVKRCIRLMRFALRLYDDRTGIKKILFSLLERIFKIPRYSSAVLRPRKLRSDADYMNLNRTAYPKHGNRTGLIVLTVDEMFNFAIRDAVILINNFHDRIVKKTPLDANLFLRNYAGSLKPDKN